MHEKQVELSSASGELKCGNCNTNSGTSVPNYVTVCKVGAIERMGRPVTTVPRKVIWNLTASMRIHLNGLRC